MRITNNMLVQDLLWNANRNLSSLSEKQNQLSSGQRVTRPSDDPVAVTQILKYKSDIRAAEQYGENIKSALGWLEVSESAIDDVKEILQRVRELTVQAANGSNTPEDTQKVQTEVAQLKDELVSLGNSTIAGRYIFSGLQTDKALFNKDGSYNIDMTTERVKDKNAVSFEIYTSEVMDVATHPLDIFGLKNETSFFEGILSPGTATTTAGTQSEMTVNFDMLNDYQAAGEKITIAIGGTNYHVNTSKLALPLTQTDVINAFNQATSATGRLEDVANISFNASNELVIQASEFGSATGITDLSSSIGFTTLTNTVGTDPVDSIYTSDTALTDEQVANYKESSELSVTLNGVRVDLKIDFSLLSSVEEMVSEIQTQLDENFPPEGTIVASGSDGSNLSLTITSETDGSINTMDVYYVKSNYFDGLLSAGSVKSTEATRSIMTADIDLTNDFEAVGEDISIEIGGVTYAVNMPSLAQTGVDPLTKSDMISAIKQASDGVGGVLSDVANIYYDVNDKLVIESNVYGSTSVITDASTSAGFSLNTVVAGVDALDAVYTSDTVLSDLAVTNYSEESTLVITVNGVQQNLELDFSTLTTADDFVAAVQVALDSKFPPAGTVVAAGTDGTNLTLTMAGANDGSVNSLDVDYVVSKKSEMLTDLDKLIAALETGDKDIISNSIGDIDHHIDIVLTAMGDIGGKSNRTEFIEARIDENVITFTKLLSNVQDVDMAEAIMLFKNLENVYKASLSVGSKVIQPSLVDFIS
jgi:flagellar hook-associated protein 3